ncbi:MAG: agmatinase [Methanobacterium sp. PtaU1.Bin242]|nr:MAG: agmatinase [Methanobacterium sp. PtaU1.Bin242]
MLFYTESPLKFAFSEDKIEFTDEYPKSGIEPRKSVWGILGVPFDSTSTYHPGARFGPNSVREASYNLERYNLLLDRNLETTFYDLGNLEVVHGNFHKTSSHLKSAIKEIKDLQITPIIIGGEHSISYSIIKALDIQDATIIHFDAHLDLRDEYMGEKYSHATVMRRVWDLNPQDMIQIGVRSGSAEETTFAQGHDIKYYTSPRVKDNIGEMERLISDIKGPVYITVDMDVLDPAYAPSVGTPAPGGLSPSQLQRLIFSLQGKEVIGFDVVEVSSRCMGDITSLNGAQVIYDFLCLQSSK